jgi:hypothetical protein
VSRVEAAIERALRRFLAAFDWVPRLCLLIAPFVLFLLFVAVALAIAAAFIHLPRVPVEMRLQAGMVRLQAAGALPLFDDLVAREIRVSPVEKALVLGTALELDLAPPAPVVLRSLSQTERGVTLGDLELGEGAWVRLIASGDGGLDLALDPDATGHELEVGYRAAARLYAGRSRDEPALALPPPPGSLALLLPPGLPAMLGLDGLTGRRETRGELPIQAVAFDDVDELRRRYSTIEGGTIHFPSLPGLEETLRPRQRLELALASATLRRIRLEADDTLLVELTGTATTLAAVTDLAGGEARRELRPTFYQFLRHQPKADAVLAAVGLLVSTILGFGLRARLGQAAAGTAPASVHRDGRRERRHGPAAERAGEGRPVDHGEL